MTYKEGTPMPPPEEPPGGGGLLSVRLSRREALGLAAGIGLMAGAALPKADRLLKIAYNAELAHPHSNIDPVYTENRIHIPDKHVVMIDGTGTNNALNAVALTPSAGRCAQVYALRPGNNGKNRIDDAVRIANTLHETSPLTTDTEQFLPSLHRLVLVGASEGGVEALLIAAVLRNRYPWLKVEGIILADMPMGYETLKWGQAVAARGMKLVREPVRESGPLARVAAEIIHIGLDFHNESIPQPAVTPFWPRMGLVAAEAIRRTHPHNYPLSAKTIADQDEMNERGPEVVSSIAQSLVGLDIRYVGGQFDPVVAGDKAFRILQDRIGGISVLPDSRFTIIENAGHATFYNYPSSHDYAQYFSLTLEEMGFPAVWDVASGQPLKSPKPLINPHLRK